MKITVRYFASLREQVGCEREELETEQIHCVGDLRKHLAEKDWPEQILCAVNCQYATDDTALKAGDEVAFFPPVTGG